MSRPAPLAVTSRAFSRNPVLREELLRLYPEVKFNETGKVLKGKDLADFLRGYRHAIVSLEAVDGPLLDELPELKLVSKYGVGLDNIDLPALQARDVLLGWVGGVNRRSVAELAICFMIALLRNLPRAGILMREKRWETLVGAQLSGKTVGIVGCGHIGKELVSLLRPFGCEVLAHDIRDYSEFYSANDVKAVSLPELLKRSDVVTIHVPCDASTRGMIGAEEFALMKPTAVLLNTARGGIVDEEALLAALVGNRIAGAAFDVFATEPPFGSIAEKLFSLPNFLATPHIGGSAAEAILAMGRAAIEGLKTAKPASEYLEA